MKNYMTLMSRYWDLCKSKSMSDTETMLYLFLLNESYSLQRSNPIELRSRYILSLIDMGQPELVTAAKRLQSLGLIEVAFSPLNETGVYMIKGVDVTDTRLMAGNFKSKKVENAPAPAPAPAREAGKQAVSSGAPKSGGYPHAVSQHPDGNGMRGTASSYGHDSSSRFGTPPRPHP